MTSKSTVHIIITLVAILLFIPFLAAQSLFDWDEINFAESAREMIVSGNYRQVQIAFEPFWEKPPLFIWMQVACMKLFGINEFAARLPNALCGIITLNLLYHFGRQIRNHFTGIFWVIAYAGSLAPALYFRSGIIDPVFNLFIFLAVWNLFQSESEAQQKNNTRWNMFLAGVFAGLAVLTKGPVALVIIFLVWVVRLFTNPRYAWSGISNFLLALVSGTLVVGIWVIPEWLHSGNWFFQEFLKYQLVLAKGQMEWHNQPWYYHVVVLLFLCFPASVFAIPQLFRNQDFAGNEKLWSSYMRTLFWVVLVLFSLITTKIIHYSSLCWLPLGWFAGNAIYKSHTQRATFKKWLLLPYALVILILGCTFTAIPFVLTQENARSFVLGLVQDKMARAIINTNAHWAGWESAVGAFLLISGFLWIFNFRKWHAHWPFTLVAIFGIMVSGITIPKTAQTLQGDAVEELKLLAKKDIYIESWGYKTYAIYYYAAVTPDKFQGPWSKAKEQYSQFQNPNTQARLDWLMNKVVDKPVYVLTKADFNPDWYFNDKFTRSKNVGPYILWIRKNIQKPDIRM